MCGLAGKGIGWHVVVAAGMEDGQRHLITLHRVGSYILLAILWFAFFSLLHIHKRALRRSFLRFMPNTVRADYCAE